MFILAKECHMEDMTCTNILLIPESNPFHTEIFGVLHSPAYDGGEIVISARLKFKASSFFTLPNRREYIPPTTIVDDDPRILSLSNILYQQRYRTKFSS